MRFVLWWARSIKRVDEAAARADHGERDGGVAKLPYAGLNTGVPSTVRFEGTVSTGAALIESRPVPPLQGAFEHVAEAAASFRVNGTLCGLVSLLRG
jgi:hypothetical protein